MRDELTGEELVFLEALSDGKRKTYVHIVRALGQPLTPMAPTVTNRIAKLLLKRGLIEKGGLLQGGFRITKKGLGALES